MLLLLRAFHYIPRQAAGERPWVQGIVVIFALYSAAVGLWVQKLMNRRTDRPGRFSAQDRWRLGNLLSLGTESSVCVWALLLYMLGGAIWLVAVLFGAGLVLLLLWKPGVSPARTEH